MTDQNKVATAPEVPACALPVTFTSVNHDISSTSHPIAQTFARAMEAAASDILDGNAYVKNEQLLSADTLTIDIHRNGHRSEWKFWTSDNGRTSTSELAWKPDKYGNTSISHAALDHFIRCRIPGLNDDPQHNYVRFLIISVDIRDISSHLRVKLAQSRNDILSAYAHRHSANPK